MNAPSARVTEGVPINNTLSLQMTQPAAYDAILAMLEQDKASEQIFLRRDEKRLNTRGWIIYEMLRQIGVCPTPRKLSEHGLRGRGQPTAYTGRTDFMLCTEFQFQKETFYKNRHRLRRP